MKARRELHSGKERVEEVRSRTKLEPPFGNHCLQTLGDITLRVGPPELGTPSRYKR